MASDSVLLKNYVNQILEGDCLEVIKYLPSESVDLIVTDPPYGISFMSKNWDTFNEIVNPQGAYEEKKGFKKLPRNKPYRMLQFFVPIWKECLRVLKPGAFTFVMCSPRQDVLCKQILALQEAGFKTGFTSIYWVYASGFPKAANIGKIVDKRFGRKREIVGYDIQGKKSAGVMAGHHGWAEGRVPITKGNSDLEGSYGGFQPKPAVEVILVAMKPLSEKTYVDQALKNKKGVTWLGDCKIPSENPIKTHGKRNGTGNSLQWSKYKSPKEWTGKIHKGRFPANLFVSDDALNDGKARASCKSSKEHAAYGDNFKFGGGISSTRNQYSDSGSFSRYFSLDAWWKEKSKELSESVQKTFPFLIVPKASKKEKNNGLEQLDDKILARSGGAQQAIKKGHQEYLQNHIGLNRISKVKNNHPTCKPIRLMSYLITLGSRKGDLILDPFVGSGTTCISAKISNRRFIGIEKERDYVEIAKARLTGVVKERQGEFWEQF